MIGEREFASAIAFSRVVPGPVMIVATLIGYRAAGLAGALAATLGVFLIPSILAAAAARHWSAVVVARWETTRCPRDFLACHATGARFAALPQAIRDEALGLLTEWAIATFGPPDTPLLEQHAFMLDICVF